MPEKIILHIFAFIIMSLVMAAAMYAQSEDFRQKCHKFMFILCYPLRYLYKKCIFRYKYIKAWISLRGHLYKDEILTVYRELHVLYTLPQTEEVQQKIIEAKELIHKMSHNSVGYGSKVQQNEWKLNKSAEKIRKAEEEFKLKQESLEEVNSIVKSSKKNV